MISAKISYADVPGQTTPTIPDGLSAPGPVFTINSTPALNNTANPFDYYRDFADLPTWTQKFTRTTAQTVTVTATYTDANGATTTATIDTEFLDRAVLRDNDVRMARLFLLLIGLMYLSKMAFLVL